MIFMAIEWWKLYGKMMIILMKNTRILDFLAIKISFHRDGDDKI